MFSTRLPTRPLAALTLAAGLVLPLAAGADPAAIAARKAHFQSYNAQIGVLVAMARGEAPYDAARAQAAAIALDDLTRVDVPALFPAGSGAESMAETRALPAIWDDLETFAQRHADLQQATAALRLVAGTDLAALRGSVGQVGGACGACHQQFRAAE